MGEPFEWKCDSDMTVGELSDALSCLPREMKIALNGREGGLYNPRIVKVVFAKADANKETYYGPHAEMDMSDMDDIREFGTECVLFARID